MITMIFFMMLMIVFQPSNETELPVDVKGSI